MKVSDTGTGIPTEIVTASSSRSSPPNPRARAPAWAWPPSYGIITQAGGTIRIYSEPGLGTTIIVLLPATDEAAPGEQPPSARPRAAPARSC